LARVAFETGALAFVPLALPFAPAGVVVEPVAVDSPLAPSAATSLIACWRRRSDFAAASRFCLADPMARAALLLGLTPPDFLAFFLVVVLMNCLLNYGFSNAAAHRGGLWGETRPSRSPAMPHDGGATR
jgi:hypothetical protein